MNLVYPLRHAEDSIPLIGSNAKQSYRGSITFILLRSYYLEGYELLKKLKLFCFLIGKSNLKNNVVTWMEYKKCVHIFL